MIKQPLISICIPAYKKVDYTRRLLDSVCSQSFRDFEVIVTDDNPGNTISDLCQEYSSQLPLFYYKNSPSLGTPENWNESIRRATGAWIKLMHDDDWFAGPESLGAYANAIEANPGATFIFCAYRNIYLGTDRSEDIHIHPDRLRALLKDPATLFSANVIGPPSVVLQKRNISLLYDPAIKWVVDIEFYMRALKEGKPVFIDNVLINVGLGSEQVTIDCFRQRPIEIPENFYLLNRIGIGHLKNWRVYDAWWRLMRNLEIRKAGDITESGYAGKIPAIILTMIRWQRPFPQALLKTGFISKLLMFVSYIFNYAKIEK